MALPPPQIASPDNLPASRPPQLQGPLPVGALGRAAACRPADRDGVVPQRDVGLPAGEAGEAESEREKNDPRLGEREEGMVGAGPARLRALLPLARPWPLPNPTIP